MEELDMNRDKSFNDRIVKFNETVGDKGGSGNTLQDINNTFVKQDEDKKSVD